MTTSAPCSCARRTTLSANQSPATGWLSDRLYRVDADHGPAGKDVSVDGWQEALDTAWLQLLDVPGVRPWVEAYLDAREDDSLVVTFGEVAEGQG